MSKRKNKKNQKIIISIISTLIVLIFGYLGININEIDKFVENINNEVEVSSNQIVEGELTVYFIDVGQADSILVCNKNETMLIDAGNNDDGEDVVKFIKDKGITKLNYIIGTHPHEDHIGGLDNVINSDLEIENILMPKIQTNTKTFEDVLDAISNKGLKVTAPSKGDSFKIGDSNCEVMTDSILDKDNLNLASIIIRLEFGSNSFLFMGDSETENENTRTWPKTDVLKVGHHGSNTSSSEKFLNQVKPTYSIIMVGEDNSYGLPKQKILDRLENIGTKIYRTDEIGTITVTCNGETVQIQN